MSVAISNTVFDIVEIEWRIQDVLNIPFYNSIHFRHYDNFAYPFRTPVILCLIIS